MKINSPRSIRSWLALNPKKMFFIFVLFSSLLSLSSAQNDLDFWNVERPPDMANIASLEVMCGKTHMEVQISFDKPFNGIIFSKGAIDQYNCIYVKPQTGSRAYSFNIMYDQCGTKPDMNGKFYENNIVIQYDKDLIEVWDEAKRLRCEWYNDYEKGITKPPIRVSDLEVVELNFRGDNVDCWMEIQHGKGPWANPVTGIVPLGTTLTMVVGINDKLGEFDMRVKSCSAFTENSRPIDLSDEHGCVLRPKMISKFMKIAGADTRASVVTYAFFHAFKFPDSMAVNIRCKVEICRYGCPDHCQKPNSYVAREQEVSSSINLPQYKPGPRFEAHKTPDKIRARLDNEIPQPARLVAAGPGPVVAPTSDNLEETVRSVRTRAEAPQHKPGPPRYIPRPLNPPHQDISKASQKKGSLLGSIFKLPDFKLPWSSNNERSGVESNVEVVPMGVKPGKTDQVPVHRTNGKEKGPQVYPSAFGGNSAPVTPIEESKENHFLGPRGLKFTKRSTEEEALDRHRRGLNDELGVHSGYQVISEVDLAFKPSFEDGVGVTVFQGRIMPEEIVYGVCLPATGFSVLFVLLSLLTVISVLVSGFVCYHRQLQKVAEEGAPEPGVRVNTSNMDRDWGISTLLRMPKA